MKLLQTVKAINRILLGKKTNQWKGDYPNWQAALDDCTENYAADAIIAAVREASLRVEQGLAAYERDSINFDVIHYSWPLATAINWAANRHNDTLTVVDFGGALGSSFRQNRLFLQSLPQVNWVVVEQESFVDIGNQEFRNHQLSFMSNLDDAINTYKPHLIVASSVLQYLENPMYWIQQIANSHADIVIFDRTMVSTENRMRLTVQTAPPSIYTAQYPCWLLNETALLAIMLEHYHLVAQSRSDVFNEVFIGLSHVAHDQCYLFKKKSL